MYINCSFGEWIIKLFSLFNLFFVNSIMNIWNYMGYLSWTVVPWYYIRFYRHYNRNSWSNCVMVLFCDLRALSKMAWKLLSVQKPLQKLNLVVVEVYGMGNLVAAFIYTWPSYHYKILVNSLKVIWNFG